MVEWWIAIQIPKQLLRRLTLDGIWQYTPRLESFQGKGYKYNQPFYEILDCGDSEEELPTAQAKGFYIRPAACGIGIQQGRMEEVETSERENGIRP